MIVTENVTIYQCEFCKKKLYKKYAMLKHEDLCNNNPKNFKACMDCKFLEKIQIDVHWIIGNPEDVENNKQVGVFKCNKLDKLMFPFSIEKKKLHERFSTYADQEPMPINCEDKEERNW
jgi:hypothetical protein